MDKQRLLADYLVEKNTKPKLDHTRSYNMKKLLIGLIILAAVG